MGQLENPGRGPPSQTFVPSLANTCAWEKPHPPVGTSHGVDEVLVSVSVKWTVIPGE